VKNHPDDFFYLSINLISLHSF